MKIVVESEDLKNKILEQSKYVHDFLEVVKYKNKKGKNKEKWIGLDSDKAGLLMHLYLNPDIIEVEEEKTKLDIVSDFVKNLETWTTLEGKDAESVHFEIDLNNLEPISVSSSFHVEEERYEIDGDIYVLLTSIGEKRESAIVQRLNKKK